MLSFNAICAWCDDLLPVICATIKSFGFEKVLAAKVNSNTVFGNVCFFRCLSCFSAYIELDLVASSKILPLPNLVSSGVDPFL